MARLEAKKLRVLVNDYYHGLITLESYREQRAELLDNIGQYVERAADTATTAINRTAPAEAEVAESGPPGKSRAPLLLGIALLLVVRFFPNGLGRWRFTKKMTIEKGET